jgi:isopentenyl phosphate kinase
MVRILKIGGSILTDKTHPASPRMKEIERIAKEVAAVSEQLILVHGAGSFGHMPAKRYGLPERFSPEGLRETHSSVARLNELVVDALGRAGADPMPVHPFSSILLREGRILRLDIGPLEEMVRSGILPVLHGDVAMDMVRRAGIVSGDRLVSYLARSMQAEAVAVGTDVEGVMVQGKILPRVTREDFAGLESSLGGSAGIDVTGGMRGKLLELLDLAESGIDSVIFNASREGQIERALKGQILGTAVRRSR